ncbi:fused MFS/spermidine synthase [Candidatus Desantisbacteria bacterium]|nr:fused MFS/spermidine synthase [Candidatus Desantisbacteria bacterium]
MKKSIFLSFFLIGFTSLISQVLLLREFMMVFYGNELSLGIVLFFWMFWTAVGSWGLGALTQNSRYTHIYLVLCQLSLIILLPAEIFLVRVLKFLLRVPEAEIIKLTSMISSSFFLLLPLCLVLGFMFSLSARIYDKKEHKDNSITISTIYLSESLGAIAGGTIYNFILIKFLNSFTISYILGSINLITSFFLIFYFSRGKIFSSFSGKILTAISIFTGIMLFFIVSLPSKKNLSQVSLNLLWKDYDLVESKNSIYGNISVVKNNNQIIFFENGIYLFTVPDPMPAEETAHISMLSHPDPQKVLLIGGGFSGVLKEMMKHSIKKITYAEIDPLIIQMAEKYLPEELNRIKNTQKLQILNMDGRHYIKTAKEKFDMIIINIGNPLTAQLNRFFTIEFFLEARSILNKGGILSIKIGSVENYISNEQQEYLSSINSTLKEVFPQVKIIPGLGSNFMLGINEKNIIQIDVDMLMDRLKKREIKTEYIRGYYLKAYMSKERTNYLIRIINQAREKKINSDFNPTCYYYNLVWWNSLLNPEYTNIFKNILFVRFWWILALIFLLFALIYLISANPASRYNNAVLTVVMANGFSEILFEIVILLVFQSLYGYVYYKMGIIITSFMLGLALGTYFARKALKYEIDAFLKLIQIEYFILSYPIILILIFIMLKQTVLPYFIIDILFPVFTIGAGFLGGYQFPFAVKSYMNKSEIGQTAGIIYGVDLLGACLGTFITNLILIPIMGIYKTFAVSVFISMCSILLLIKSAKNS